MIGIYRSGYLLGPNILGIFVNGLYRYRILVFVIISCR
jgi:hypothetical protein